LQNLEGGVIYGGFERQAKEGSERGSWREGSFTGDPEGYVKEGSGNWCLSP